MDLHPPIVITPTPKMPNWLRWQIGLSFVAFILIGASDGAVGILLPSIREYYKVDKGTVGLLFAAGTLGYLTAAPISGLIVEKLGQRLFLMLGLSAFAIGVAGISLKPPFEMVFVALILVGFGIATVDAGLNAYVAGLPGSTAILNYLHAFYGIGALIGPLIASGVLAFGWGWNSVYTIWIGVSLLVLVGVGLVFQKKVATDSNANKDEGNTLFITLRTGVVWLAAIFLLIYVGAEVSLGNWSYSFLTEERQIETLFSGWMVTGYWLGLTLGRLLLARVALRLGNRRMIQGCLIGVILGLVIIWISPFTLLTAFGLFLTGFCLGPVFPTMIALMPDLVPARILPSAIGFMVSFAAVGAALFPWIAGILAQGFGLLTLLPYVIILSVINFGCWQLLQSPRWKASE